MHCMQDHMVSRCKYAVEAIIYLNKQTLVLLHIDLWYSDLFLKKNEIGRARTKVIQVAAILFTLLSIGYPHLLNLVVSGSMDKQEPIADVEQKIGLTEKPKEQVLTFQYIAFTFCLHFLLTVSTIYLSMFPARMRKQLCPQFQLIQMFSIYQVKAKPKLAHPTQMGTIMLHIHTTFMLLRRSHSITKVSLLIGLSSHFA